MVDFAATLVMAEREAELALAHLPQGPARECLQRVATDAHLLRARLDVASSLIFAASANSERRDFLGKLEHLEREALGCVASLAPGVSRDRAEHIAKLLRSMRAQFAA
jgi:hypothetical protein